MKNELRFFDVARINMIVKLSTAVMARRSHSEMVRKSPLEIQKSTARHPAGCFFVGYRQSRCLCVNCVRLTSARGLRREAQAYSTVLRDFMRV